MYEIQNNNGKFDLMMNGELLHSFNNEGYAKGSMQLLWGERRNALTQPERHNDNGDWTDMSKAEALMTLKFSGQLKADRNA
jgi:hypothetical protein